MTTTHALRVEPLTGRPRRIQLDGVWRRVRRIIDGWTVRSRWWGTEERRLYVLLEADDLVVEVYRSGDRWTLARIVD